MKEEQDALLEMKAEVDKKIFKLINKELNKLVLGLEDRSLNSKNVKERIGELIGGRTKEIALLLGKLIEKLNKKGVKNEEVDKLKKELAARLLHQVDNEVGRLSLDSEIKISYAQKLFEELGETEMAGVCDKLEKATHEIKEYFEQETEKYYAQLSKMGN